MGYPNMLAGFNPNVGSTVPFELWAGESDLVTSQGTAGVNIPQFTVIMYDSAFNLVPWSGHQGAPGTGSLILTQGTGATSFPVDGDTFTIGGVVATYRNTPDPTKLEIHTVTTNMADAANATFAFFQAHEADFGVIATSLTPSNFGGIQTIAIQQSDNSDGPVTLAKSGSTLSVSGPTTSTGNDGGTKPCGFAAQPAVKGGPIAFYTGGVPNHKALLWPASCNTLAARKAAFAGSNMTIGSLL